MSKVYTFYENLFLSNFLNFDENNLMIRTKLNYSFYRISIAKHELAL